FDDGMRLVREMAETVPVTIVNSINPYRLQGQKTAAFEIVDELGDAPDYHCLPVGDAGNISTYWTGYSDYADSGHASFTPQMPGYQASGSAPFLRGEPVAEPETVATAIRIGNPQSWQLAWQAHDESGGRFDELDDSEILATQKRLAEREGVFCEPASATSLAGALRDIKAGRIAAGSRVVCTLTGHGLKDPDVAIAQGGGLDGVETVDASREAVTQKIQAAL